MVNVLEVFWMTEQSVHACSEDRYLISHTLGIVQNSGGFGHGISARHGH